MDFLELINKCLLELNYKQVNTFSELVKQDHKRIVSILNIINKEVCNTENWNFLLRKTKLTIPAQTTEIENPVSGRILYVLSKNGKYKFVPDVEYFFDGSVLQNAYSFYHDKLLFPKSEKSSEVDVIYYTKNCVISSDGQEKENLEDEDDATLIPMPFAEQILVYGTCMRIKANPQYIKFSYWASMYKEALLNLKSKTSVYFKDTPSVKLFRN